MEAMVERMAQVSVLPVRRNDEQENPRERCYCCLPASSYYDFSQRNRDEKHSKKLGKASNKSLRNTKMTKENTANKIEFQHNYT